jgi:23S rRNA (guanine745-N1)-methyltransferase
MPVHAPAAAALKAVATRLRCPHCGAPVTVAEGALVCDRGHGYDRARQGHVTLLPPRGRLPLADSAAMVAAREAFLDAGHYAPIAQAVAHAAREGAGPLPGRPGCVVDLAAGTGHHLAAVLDALQGWWGIAVDASRPALRRAVRAHARIAAIACDVWAPLPLRDGSADVVLCVFGPRNGPEIARVLSADGVLVLVTPAPEHLCELVPALGMLRVDAGKRERVERALSPHLTALHRRPVAFEMALGHDDVRALVAMGPSAYHVRPDEVEERVARLPEPVRVTAAVVVETFRRAG